MDFRSDEPRRLSAVTNIRPEGIIAAASLVRRGIAVPLNARLDREHPIAGLRPPLQHTTLMLNERRGTPGGDTLVVNDAQVTFALQGSSHIDALSHVGKLEAGSQGVFFDGAPLSAVDDDGIAQTLGIGCFGGAIVTRGVLVDVVAAIAPDRVGSRMTSRSTRRRSNVACRSRGSPSDQSTDLFAHAQVAHRLPWARQATSRSD
jgi:hypothetical protein